MARIELAAQVADDFDRILEHLAQYEVVEAAARIDQIIQAINVLESNPLLGRPARNDMRELINRIEQADAYVLASPTNFGSVTALFKQMPSSVTSIDWDAWYPLAIFSSLGRSLTEI